MRTSENHGSTDVLEVGSSWGWQPPTDPWYQRLGRLVLAWSPDPGLGLDVPHIKDLLLDAVAMRAEWLLHPSLSAVMRQRQGFRCDLQLAVWSAQNLQADLGNVELPESAWAWAPGGGIRLAPGTHDLSDITGRIQGSSYESPIAIDPWAHSMWAPFHQLWRETPDLDPDELDEFVGDTRRLLLALEYARERLPQLFQWVGSRTRVVILLRKLRAEHASSSSAVDIPGAIFVTVHDEIQAIEAMVHESAHQHLFMSEVAAPLVDPRDTELYGSPLRDDPRPLRGLLLAYHALAYISAYYADALATSIAESSHLEKRLDRTRSMMQSSQRVVHDNRGKLTEIGIDFVERTAAIGRYSA